MDRKLNRSGSIRRRSKARVKISYMVLLVILAIIGAGFWAHNTDLASGMTVNENPVTPIIVEAEEPEEEKPEWEPKEPLTHMNVLLLGLDNNGMNDLVMIFSYHLETFDTNLIALKRDTYVENQTWAIKESGQDHLAWANNRGMGPDNDFHAGARLTAQTVEDLLGMDLHAYATVSFDGFISIVDSIGGVEINVAREFAQRSSSPLPAGLQRLDGEQALIYARHRQSPRIPEPGSTSQHGDRLRRNQRLLKAILKQCKTLETDELMDIYNQLDDKLNTSMEDWDILDLINVLYNRNPDDINTVILPGEGERVYQERIDKDVYYYFLDFEKSNEILQELGLK